LSELFAGKFHKFLCPIRQRIFSEFQTLDIQKSNNSTLVEAEAGGNQANSIKCLIRIYQIMPTSRAAERKREWKWK
jgi:hypothetical protein